MATVAVTHFSDRLADAVERKSSQLVVGLDPVVEQMPAEVDGDLLAFCSGIVDAVAPYAVAVKPQSAFFEAHGADGVRAFAQVCEYARAAGLIVIADVKRGDIGSTARAYAQAYIPTPSSLFSTPAGERAAGSSAS
jgi:orotidine-5'-phosphate decarboxylase